MNQNGNSQRQNDDHSSSVVYRYPTVFSNYPQIAAAESTRHGGVSTVPFESLNLGLHTADDPLAVAENRKRFFAALGFTPLQVAVSHQVHGAKILRVEEPGFHEGYDALMTDKPQILLAVTIADCTPILVFDPVQHAVAAIHAGWKGTAAKIVCKTLEAMQRTYGTKMADCFAYVGTCIDYCDFEVDADVADHFDPEHKRWNEVKQKYFVDLKAANQTQLLDGGLSSDHIQISPFSTIGHNQDYFSHRLEKGKTGRMLATIGLRF
jgi:YfiH family protein